MTRGKSFFSTSAHRLALVSLAVTVGSWMRAGCHTYLDCASNPNTVSCYSCGSRHVTFKPRFSCVQDRCNLTYFPGECENPMRECGRNLAQGSSGTRRCLVAFTHLPPAPDLSPDCERAWSESRQPLSPVTEILSVPPEAIGDVSGTMLPLYPVNFATGFWVTEVGEQICTD